MENNSANGNLANGKSLRVAIVHDWLIGGGAETVVLELHKMFPGAPIYTSYCTAEWRKKLDGKVITGFLQHWPYSKLRKFLPVLRMLWFGSLDLSNYDLIISSTGAEAKNIRVQAGVKHICYIHAPTHYYWSRYDEYLKNPGTGPLSLLSRAGLKLLIKPMRRWDYSAAQGPDHMVANSTHTQEQIKKYYGRDSTVIWPPVDTEYFKVRGARLGARDRNGFVITGRQTPYKRIDLAVEACTRLRLPLSVIGDGPEHRRLRSIAGPSIKFLGKVSRGQLRDALQSAQAFIFPGLDDFGIAAAEALAAGTPVIAYRAGGALDYVVPGTTGEFFEDQTVDSLVSALNLFDPKAYSAEVVSTHSMQFSPQAFTTKLQAFIRSL